MGACLSTERRTQLLSGAALAAAAAAVWCLTSSRGLAAFSCMHQGGNRGGRAAAALDEKATERLMQQMSEAFFCVFTELAQVARSVAQAVQNHSFEPGEAPTKRQVEAMLMEQVFRERLYTAEADVLRRHNVSKEALEAACNRFRQKNEKIALYYEGLREMYEEAVNGELPLLPGAVLPPETSEEMILAVLQQVHAVKREKFVHLLADAQPSDFRTPGPAMAKKLQQCNREAEQQVLSMPQYASLTEALLLHAVALYSRNPTFRIKKQLLDEMHSEHVMAMMEKRKNQLQACGVYTPESDCVVAALHPKLEEVSAAELLSRLRSAAEEEKEEREGGGTAAVAVLVLRGGDTSSSSSAGGATAAAAAAAAKPAAAAAASRRAAASADRLHEEKGGEEGQQKKRDKEEGRDDEGNVDFLLLQQPGNHKAGVSGGGLRALNDFCEAIDSIDHKNFSFLFVEHQEVQQLPIAALKTAAADAQICGAAYLLFKGSQVLKQTTLLKEFLEAAGEMKKEWEEAQHATTTAAASAASPSSSSSAAAAAVADAATDIPPACPLLCTDGGSPTASTEAAAAEFPACSAAVSDAAAVDDITAVAVAAASGDAAAAASPTQTQALLACNTEKAPCRAAAAAAVGTAAEQTTAAAAAPHVLAAMESNVFFDSDVSTIGHADAGDETLLPSSRVNFSGLGKCAT